MSVRPSSLVAGILFAWVASAGAAPMSVTFEGVSPAVGNAGQYNWNTGPTAYTGLVYTPFGNGSASANHFVTFCIERNQHVHPNTTYDSYLFTAMSSSPVPGPFLSAGTADAIRSMWAEHRDDLGVTDTTNRSAAFQHAVWHLIDPTYNPSLPGGMAGYYTTYLDPAGWQSGLANLVAMTNGTSQDQLLELKDGFTVRDNEIVPTPEPTALVIGLIAAPAVYLRRRLLPRAG